MTAIVALAFTLAATWTMSSAPDIPNIPDPPDGVAVAVATPSRPNLILVVGRELGYAQLGCYGQHLIQTPGIDRMAAEGMRFTQYYSGGTGEAAAQAALLTGRHTGHARIRGNHARSGVPNPSRKVAIPLTPHDPTMAETLSDAGYKTGFIGCWFLGGPRTTGSPLRKGFDEFFGFPDVESAAEPYPRFLWRNDRRVPIAANAGGKDRLYAPDLFTGAALNFIRMHGDTPFFLCVYYPLPHPTRDVPSLEPYSLENWPDPEKAFAAMTTRLDHAIGRMREELETLGIENRTVLILTGDHGPRPTSRPPPASATAASAREDPAFFGVHGVFGAGKGPLSEGALRRPLIVCWPGQIRGGSVDAGVWAAWDIFATGAALAGAPAAPENTDGMSMLPAWIGPGARGHGFLYWETHEPRFQQAVRMGNWKAVRDGLEKPIRLFDIDSDPAELGNVAEQERLVVSQVESYLEFTREPSPFWSVHPDNPAHADTLPKPTSSSSANAATHPPRP